MRNLFDIRGEQPPGGKRIKLILLGIFFNGAPEKLFKSCNVENGHIIMKNPLENPLILYTPEHRACSSHCYCPRLPRSLFWTSSFYTGYWAVVWLRV